MAQRQRSTQQQGVVAARELWLRKIRHADHLAGPFKLLPPTITADNLDVFAAEFNRLRSVFMKALRAATKKVGAR